MSPPPGRPKEGSAFANEPLGGTARSAKGASKTWLDEVRFNHDGLVTVIAQDAATARVLMVAWANREALTETAASCRAVYWSRSRQRLWRKGEESGHRQSVREIRLDCDGDVVLYAVDSTGGIACHTGRESCFFRRLDGEQWQAVDPVLKDPELMYGK